MVQRSGLRIMKQFHTYFKILVSHKMIVYYKVTIEMSYQEHYIKIFLIVFHFCQCFQLRHVRKVQFMFYLRKKLLYDPGASLLTFP